MKVPQPRWIDRADGVEEIAEACRGGGGLALDTEADSLHSYFHKVCLMQVTVDDQHWVVDTLALGRSDLAPLLEVVADPEVTVTMHGADYDVRMLDRDWSATVRGLRDTQIMAQLLGEPRTGLAALLEKHFGLLVDKRFQRADWGRRPLPAELLAYAAGDTAHLSALAERLHERLAALGRWEWAEEEFRCQQEVRHSEPVRDELAFERIKGARSLRGAARNRLFTLFEWRDREARRADVPPFKIAGNRQLVLLAQQAPRDLGEMARTEGLGPRFVRRWGRAVLGRLRSPDEAPAAAPRSREAPPPNAARRRLAVLASVRDTVAGQLEVQPGLLCPKSMMETLAAVEPPPRTVDGIAQAGLGGWRLQQLGERFADALGSG